MRCRPSYLGWLFSGLALAALAGPASSQAQDPPPDPGGFPPAFAPAGVEIDPSGVFRVKTVLDPGGRLTAAKFASARTSLPAEVVRKSDLRKVSLPRLEKAIAARLAGGEAPTEEMKYLAGLTSVKYIFLYPETGDIVLAGPAGGFASDAAGRAVSLVDGTAVIELQDVITALRAYPPTGDSTQVIACSIDPTAEGLARMQDYLKRVSGTNVTPAMTSQIVGDLRASLGNQTVSITGVSPKTHFAEVLVEADYRMKLIGIGLEQVPPGVKIPSYTSATRPGEGSRNALQRWFFTPKYDELTVSEDGTALELTGQSVQLIGVDEMVRQDGSRAATGSGESRASKTFTTAFTKEYEKLAKASPVYDQLQNLIDVAVAAAYIQKNDWYGQADWAMDVFGDESVLSVESGVEPKEVGTAVNAIWRGRTLVTPIGGGVNIQPMKAIESDRLKAETNNAVSSVRKASAVEAVPANRWWWD